MAETASSSSGILLATIGTGDLDRLEETLIAPFRRTIGEGRWHRIILLPSRSTTEQAQLVRSALADRRLEIDPLPGDGQENDADACYAHFDAVIRRLIDEGTDAQRITVDFTRGTKAMSAALVLAGVRHGISRFRYLAGERDGRGTVKAGFERVAHLAMAAALGHKRLDLGRDFLRAGHFAAAREVFARAADPDSGIAEELRAVASRLESIAGFYAAWDRLDYKAAARADPETTNLQPPWDRYAPAPDARKWIERLAQPLPGEGTEKADRLRDLAADLLANGERRIRDRHFEDAVLRAYRVLELVGQIRLLQRGLDSGRLPCDHPLVVAMHTRLEEKGDRERFGENRDGTLTAGRQLVARMLKLDNDPLAKRLLALGESGPFAVQSRNKSILIHGFEAVGPEDEKVLEDLYAELEELLAADGGEAAWERLRVARSADLSRG